MVLAALFLTPSRADAATGNLIGRVTDAASGAGVSGVSIWPGFGTVTATTDGAGNYSFSVASGSGYNVMADKTGYAKAHRYGVSVAAGGSTRVDFSITSQQGRISGRVVDTANHGVPGQVLADSIEGNGFNVANTDSNGFFTIDRLAPMSYYVHAFPSSSASPSAVISGVGVSNGGTTQVTVVSGGNAGRISGQVTLPNGAPAPNAKIYIDGSTGSFWNGATDGNGVYSSGLLSAGTYNVHLSDVPGYGNQLIFGQGLSSGQTLSGVNFRLANNVGSVRGWVRDALGNPVAGAGVDAMSVASTGPWGWQSVTTDSTGWYSFDNLLPSNRYKVWVHTPDRPQLTGDWIVVNAGQITQPYNFTYPIPSRAVVSNPAGGYYVLAGDGTVFARGGAPLFGSPHFANDMARAMAVMPDGRGYVVLDGFGGLHKFGSANAGVMGTLGGAYFGWDIARGIAITPSGAGLDVLDGYGGVHTSGNAVVDKSPYFGWDIARGIALSPSGLGVYVLDGYGGVHTSGDAVPRPAPYFGWDIARSLVVTASGQGYAILDGFGGIHATGDAPAPKSNSSYAAKDLWRGLARVGAGYMATRSDGSTIAL